VPDPRAPAGSTPWHHTLCLAIAKRRSRRNSRGPGQPRPAASASEIDGWSYDVRPGGPEGAAATAALNFLAEHCRPINSWSRPPNHRSLATGPPHPRTCGHAAAGIAGRNPCVARTPGRAVPHTRRPSYHRGAGASGTLAGGRISQGAPSGRQGRARTSAVPSKASDPRVSRLAADNPGGTAKKEHLEFNLDALLHQALRNKAAIAEVPRVDADHTEVLRAFEHDFLN